LIDCWLPFELTLQVSVGDCRYSSPWNKPYSLFCAVDDSLKNISRINLGFTKSTNWKVTWSYIIESAIVQASQSSTFNTRGYEELAVRLWSPHASSGLRFYNYHSWTFDHKRLNTLGTFGASYKTGRKQRSVNNSGYIGSRGGMGRIHVSLNLSFGRNDFKPPTFGFPSCVCVVDIYSVLFLHFYESGHIWSFLSFCLSFWRYLWFCTLPECFRTEGFEKDGWILLNLGHGVWDIKFILSYFLSDKKAEVYRQGAKFI